MADGSSPARTAVPDMVRLLQRVAVAANEADSVEAALRTTLEAVCEELRVPVGHAYLREGDALVPTAIWHLPATHTFAAFIRETERTRFGPGEGLPGRVMQRGEPEWMVDVRSTPEFIRKQGAEGLGAAFACPILTGRDVVGVLEFFHDQPQQPPPAVLEAMLPVGIQLGRVVERERAQEALRSSEAKFAGIISISSDAIVSVDEAQRIIFFNQGAEQVFGYQAEEVMGERLEMLIPPRFREPHEAQVREFGDGRVQARRMGERGQIVGMRKNGEVFPADASISKLELEGRRIYTAVLRDVTERQKAEQALARQAEELARSNAELEQFAYVASHDLQEPLRMVASYTQLLARRYQGKLDDDADEFIAYAVEGVTRMQALINDLLAYSRVGTKSGNFGPVRSGEVLERVLVTLRPAMEEADARITADPLPTLCADGGQLGQIFQNLIANAVKFRGDQPPQVHVSAQRSRKRWVISVADNGIGISPEFRERIFVIFQRLHNRTEYPGTGIGLAICKKIVERHGGRIWVESGAGTGSTFFFTMPDEDHCP